MIAMDERDRQMQLDMSRSALDFNEPGNGTYEKLLARIEELEAMGPRGAPVNVDDGVDRYRRGGQPASNQFGTFEVHQASDKQVAFVKRLVAEKDTAGVKIPADLDQISKKAASAIIDRLIDRPNKVTTTQAPTRLASEKQRAFVRRLLAERDLAGTAYVAWDDVLIDEHLSPADASAAIDDLMSRPRAERVVVPLEAGIYRNPDTAAIYKVYTNQARTRMLAKLLVLPEGWLDVPREQRAELLGKPNWDYQGVAERFVQPAWRMTLEQAKEFGTIYGVCCDCGALLTDENSIKAGIGPWCARKEWA